jgi:predicted nucleic acid-binding protein
MQIILNSSPLIFLAKLDYLNKFIDSSDDFYIPQSVADEISVKQDPASQTIQSSIASDKLQVRASSLAPLVNSLNQRLGRGESEAIALGIELNADYVLLDDSTARREAKRLGLTFTREQGRGKREQATSSYELRPLKGKRLKREAAIRHRLRHEPYIFFLFIPVKGDGHPTLFIPHSPFPVPR